MGFADDHLIPLVDGLGNSAYLLDFGDGRALAMDAGRDLRALRTVAERRGLRVAFAAETHLHADFLSGAVQLGHDTGATILASAAGRRAFAHQALVDGDEVGLGGLTLRALATPGHTDEHLSFLLLDGSRELGVFTGGSLIVNSAARTDLLGAERTADRAAGRPYVDVRQEAEFATGHVPGALRIELGALSESAADAPAGPVVACGHGERAMTAASLLERAGHTDIAVLNGGPDDYTAAHGQQLAQGMEGIRS